MLGLSGKKNKVGNLWGIWTTYLTLRLERDMFHSILVQFHREGYYSCGNRAVDLTSQRHSQQLKWVAGLKEVAWFSLCDDAGAAIVLRPGRFCSGEPETKMWCVSSKQCFVSIIWSFSVSSKVELERTLCCSGQIYGKACYYRRNFLP